MDNTADKVIHVKDLTKRFGDFTAVDRISFSVTLGEIFGFLGANGAGKTTAMRMLCGLSVPTAGQGTVAGCDILTQSEQIKKHIGYMSQKFSLYGQLTVAENIRLFGSIYGMTSKAIKTRTAELLDMLDFSSERNTPAGSLPLGWKQKLSFAVATVHRPEVVFLDEPTGALDSKSSKMLLEQFERLNQKFQTTILMVTHDAFAASYANRVIFIKDGKVFNELVKGDDSRKVFFDAIIDVITLLGGDASDVL